MERGDRELVGDVNKSELAPEATPQESRLRRRRNLRQGLSHLRTIPNHQGFNTLFTIHNFFRLFVSIL